MLASEHDLVHHKLHSPSGFEWGYHGSGCAELARCILIDYLGGLEQLEQDAFGEHSVPAYQEFKRKFIADVPEEGFLITDAEIAASFVLEQDAIFVGGGNTRSMLAVWREWELDRHLRAAWEKGIVLGGASAGSICWFEHGLTDSVAGPLTAMPCLGFLPGSNCPHYDSEPLRRPTFRKLIASGNLPDGVAADDGVGLHYVDGRLARVVSSRPRAKGYRVTRTGKRAVERQLPTRYFGKT